MHSLHFQIEDICAFSAIPGEMHGSLSSEGVVTLPTSLLMFLDWGPSLTEGSVHNTIM